MHYMRMRPNSTLWGFINLFFAKFKLVLIGENYIYGIVSNFLTLT